METLAKSIVLKLTSPITEQGAYDLAEKVCHLTKIGDCDVVVGKFYRCGGPDCSTLIESTETSGARGSRIKRKYCSNRCRIRKHRAKKGA